MPLDIKKLMMNYESLKGDRGNWENHWDELMPYVLPRKHFRRDDFIDGEKRVKGQILFDATAIHSNELLASALHGMLTNPAVQWFELLTGDKELDNNPEVKKWLQTVTKLIHDQYNDSNFQTEIHETYIDLGSIGTTILLQEENDNPELPSDIFFRARTVLRAVLDEDEKGLIDSVYFHEKMTVKNLIQKYGVENIPTECLKGKHEPARKWKVIHAIFPKNLFGADDDPGISKAHKWASVHILTEKDHVLKAGGFHEFPAACPRWTKLSGEIYGRSPSMKSFPDILMINEMKKTTIRSGQKIVDPPMVVPDDGVTLPLNINPGGINYKRPGVEGIEPLKTEGRVDFGFQLISDVKLDIRQAYFIDQLQLASDGPQMTATEVQQRIEEKLRLLGPILGRQNFELLRPLVERTLKILTRRNKLPELPEIMKDRDGLVKVQYSSQIAKAQRVSQTNDLNRAFGMILPVLQMEPQLMDVLDGEAFIRVVANIFGIPAEIVNDPRKVEQIRKMREAMAAQQAQNQQEMADAEKVQKVSKAIPQNGGAVSVR